MKHLVWLLALALGSLAWAGDDTATVLVRTMPARQGSLPAIIEAYGTAQSGPNGSQALSMPFDSMIAASQVEPGEQVRAGDILLRITPTPAALVQIEQAQSGLIQARAALAHARVLLASHLATLDQLQAARKTLADAATAAKSLQAARTLVAPADGVVSQVAGGPGVMVSAGNPLVTLQRDGGLEAVVGIEPADRTQVAAGAAVSVTALDDNSTANGLRLRRIARGIDAKSRLIDGFVPLPAGRFVADQPLKAAIVTGIWHGWLVPRDAVVVDVDGDRLFQIRDGKAVAVAVTITGGNDANLVVAGAIDPALPIVISGQSQLDGGSAVRMDAP